MWGLFVSRICMSLKLWVLFQKMGGGINMEKIIYVPLLFWCHSIDCCIKSVPILTIFEDFLNSQITLLYSTGWLECQPDWNQFTSFCDLHEIMIFFFALYKVKINFLVRSNFIARIKGSSSELNSGWSSGRMDLNFAHFIVHERLAWWTIYVSNGICCYIVQKCNKIFSSESLISNFYFWPSL